MRNKIIFLTLITTLSILTMFIFVGINAVGCKKSTKTSINAPTNKQDPKTDTDKELAKLFKFEKDPMTQNYEITKCFSRSA